MNSRTIALVVIIISVFSISAKALYGGVGQDCAWGLWSSINIFDWNDWNKVLNVDDYSFVDALYNLDNSDSIYHHNRIETPANAAHWITLTVTTTAGDKHHLDAFTSVLNPDTIYVIAYQKEKPYGFPYGLHGCKNGAFKLERSVFESLITEP